MTHIVKRRGHKEKFDPRKVYASVYAACRNAHLGAEQSEKIAEQVASHIEKWVDDKDLITAQEIFEEVIRKLGELEKDASFMYETHRDLA